MKERIGLSFIPLDVDIKISVRFSGDLFLQRKRKKEILFFFSRGKERERERKEKKRLMKERIDLSFIPLEVDI